MNPRRLWLAFALFLLAPALAGLAADKDLYGDPLPEGAKARIGTARLRTQSFTSALLTPDGKTLYANSGSGLARFDPATGEKLGKAPAQHYGTLGAFSANGKVGVHLMFGRLLVWDVESGKTLAKVERGLPGSDASASLSADGKVLAIGGVGDRAKKTAVTVLVWDVAADKQLQSIAVPQNDSANVAISADGKTVATWGSHSDPEAKAPDPETNLNRFVHFWDAATGKEIAKFRVAGYSPSTVAFGPTGSLVAIAGNNSTIDLVDAKTGTSKHLLLGRTRMGRWIAFSPDGTVIAATAEDGAVQRWRVSDGSRLSTTEAPTSNLSSARLRALDNDKGIAWGTKNSMTVVWEIPSGKLLSPEGGHSAMVRGVAVTPDNKHVITSADDGTTLKWELATGKPAGAVTLRQPNTGYVTYMPAGVFSADVTKALVRDTSGGIGVHDMATGAQQFVIPTPTEGGSLAAFSADGSKVVVTSSSYDPKKIPARVSVWDATTSKRLGSMELPGYSQIAAAVTPDGKHLVTAGTKPGEKMNSFVVTGWELATGAKKGELVEASGFNIPHVAASPDNKTAAVVTGKGQVFAFDILAGTRGKVYETKTRAAGLAPVFSPDGKRLALVCQSDFGENPKSPILVIDWESGETKYTFSSAGQTPQTAVFSPDGKSLVTGSPDTTATVWDVSK